MTNTPPDRNLPADPSRRRRRAGAAACALALTLGAGALPAAAAPPDRDAGDLFELLNAERTGRGLLPVRLDATLAAGAAAHADALAAGGRLFHTSMVESAPHGWTRLGENVAAAHDMGAAHRALLASPTHRAVMLDPAFDAVGLGVTSGRDGTHWVSMKLADVAAPVVGRVSTASGAGHWEVDRDGGVTASGDAAWHGSLAGTALAGPIVGMAALPDGGGYWLAGADGGVFAFGAARFLGAAAGTGLRAPVTSINRNSTGTGYALRTGDGVRYGFGDAR